MKLFGTIYDKTMEWSKHRFAAFWLSFVSFIEAIFFPIPPDVMLIPMSMSKPQNATKYAIYTTVASVLGGIIGYFIGLYAFDWVQGIIADWGMQANFDKAKSWFETWGVAVVFLAGFSPIPYKVFTICAGVMQMAFFPFVVTAAVSRFARFILVAKLSAWGGEKYAEKIRRSIELIGWGTIALAVVAYLAYELFK
ncbi:DedA family protein [Actinobacillus equuli subsp. equuli]|uniref:DedA family protein n=2 Tax=Actinobacillus equuli TaxID=718 RepID=A0A0A7MGK6_ACTEU|nr:YqaA family protein [Actinobacillus equuli]AIZ79694.1 membrane protein [Actinobacillus equuli subsp. equuli]MDE8034446.1 DedA family protein [Actinobacillus equuli subsp. equuli]MDG4947492.1 DedA family protein [Actinobacillus equuli subsp. haemolyticus]MDG4952928.1 DedA family protein [Actinobacillus equuli subsp. equuli]WGE43804.1 DedA family protein [Actinobacillus equuli subsp. equuli]